MLSLNEATVVDTEGDVFYPADLPRPTNTISCQVWGLDDGEVTIEARGHPDAPWKAIATVIAADDNYVIDGGATQYRAVLSTANTGAEPVSAAFTAT